MLSAIDLLSILTPICQPDANPDATMEVQHYCNAAIEACDDLAGKLIELAYTWEDSNVAEYEEALHLADKIEQIAPGHFVLITTSDYITSASLAYGRETYDAHYYCYLITNHQLAAVAQQLNAFDAAWRAEKTALANA